MYEAQTRPCPACGAPGGQTVYRIAALPVNSCLLVDSAAEARSLPNGQLELVCCDRCGFLSNRRFREELAAYTDRYEDSQAFSPTFLEYARSLATGWVDDWGLAGKVVVELGAGRGDFSRILVEAGAGTVVAMDPTLTVERAGDDLGGRVVWLSQRFDQASGLPPADAVVFRHVLEHVAEPVALLTALRRALDGRPDVPVLVEIPDARRILAEGAFWDVYYEHCSYFTPATVRSLFGSCGFEVRSVSSVYAGQYLLVAATPTGVLEAQLPDPAHVARLVSAAHAFGPRVQAAVADVDAVLTQRSARRQDVVLWGSGSKATAFLTLLGTYDGTVSRVVDVNVYKQGRFVLGSGLPIVSPEMLVAQPPDLVVVMNPVYTEEIEAQLAGLGVETDVVSVGSAPAASLGS